MLITYLHSSRFKCNQKLLTYNFIFDLQNHKCPNDEINDGITPISIQEYLAIFPSIQDFVSFQNLAVYAYDIIIAWCWWLKIYLHTRLHDLCYQRRSLNLNTHSLRYQHTGDCCTFLHLNQWNIDADSWYIIVLNCSMPLFYSLSSAVSTLVHIQYDTHLIQHN